MAKQNIKSAHEVTPKKETHSETMFMNLAEQLSTAVIVITKEMKIAFANKAAKKYLKTKFPKGFKIQHDYSGDFDKNEIMRLFKIDSKMHFSCQSISWENEDSLLLILSVDSKSDIETSPAGNNLGFLYHYAFDISTAKITDGSDEFNHLTEFSTGDDLAALIHPDDYKDFLKRVKSLKQSDNTTLIVADHRIISKSNKVYYVRNRLTIESTEGRSDVVHAYITLISDLVLENEYARATKEFYESLLKLSVNAYFKYDLIKDTVYYRNTRSDKSSDLIKNRKISRNTLKNFIAFDDYPYVIEAFDKYLSNPKGIFTVKLRALFKNDWKWVETRLIVIANDELGNPSMLAGVMIDIDDYYGEYVNLQNRCSAFDTLIENLDQGFMRIDDTGKITHWNKSIEKLSGLDAELAIGEYIWDLQAFYFRENTSFVIDKDVFESDILTNLLNNGPEPIKFETRFRTIDGIDKIAASTQYRLTEGGKPTIYYFFEDVSEQYQTPEQDTNEVSMLKEILSFTNQIIYKKNLVSGRYLYISHYVIKLLGYTPEEFIKFSDAEIFAMIHPDDINNFQNFHLSPNLRNDFNETTSQLEYRIKTKSGKYKSIRDTHTYIIDKGSNKAFLIGRIEDIGEQKLRQQEQIENTEKFKKLLEHQSDLLITKDDSGVVNYLSPSFCELFGVDELEILGTKYEYQIHPDDIAGLKESLDILNSAKPCSANTEHRALTKYGWRWFSWACTSYITNDRVAETLYVGRDITKQKRIEEALRLSENKYRSIFELAQDAIIIFEPNDEIVLDVNHKAEEMYGFDKSQFIGMSLEAISTNVSHGKSQISRTFRSNEKHRFVTTQKRSDGTTFKVEINAAIIEYDGKSVVMSINREI
ncbi:MAG: PAS domain S-box protein [Desulfobulbaceae bacterium]|nr:PAS domain S-box protein [Candidatus Kapabacteria bacterium]MBS4000427.1 PAS domain S-box protein [Desulfobulbaceae bacterium]